MKPVLLLESYVNEELNLQYEAIDTLAHMVMKLPGDFGEMPAKLLELLEELRGRKLMREHRADGRKLAWPYGLAGLENMFAGLQSVPHIEVMAAVVASHQSHTPTASPDFGRNYEQLYQLMLCDPRLQSMYETAVASKLQEIAKRVNEAHDLGDIKWNVGIVPTEPGRYRVRFTPTEVDIKEYLVSKSEGCIVVDTKFRRGHGRTKLGALLDLTRQVYNLPPPPSKKTDD